jgi:hypothetical protein
MNSGITPLTPQEEAEYKREASQEGYLKREAVAIDIFANETTDGLMDETISSRMSRWATSKVGIKGFVGRVISKGLDLIQNNHGAKAQAGDLERAEQVEKTELSSGNLPTR